MLLGAQTSDPEGFFSNALASGRERQVDLETPVPVYLSYQSAWVDEHGVPQYRADVYGRDGEPCHRCDRPVTAIVQGQRATYYCKVCQT